MKKSGSKITFGLGIACLLCGVYWLYKGEEILEIILPIILGIGLIGSSYFRLGKKSADV